MDNEVYPSDSYLEDSFTEHVPTGITLLTDIDSGVLPWNKLFYRLTKAVEAVADLRVFDEGSLDVGVKSGYFWNGNTLVTFAAKTGQTLADDKSKIYIFLDAAGNLVIDEYDSFPDQTTPHVRLAEVTTSSGDITDITDRRAQNQWMTPRLAAQAAVDNIMCHEGEVMVYENEVLLY